MGNPSCVVCLAQGVDATENAWWHKAAKERNPLVLHPKVHTFEPESEEEFNARMDKEEARP